MGEGTPNNSKNESVRSIPSTSPPHESSAVGRPNFVTIRRRGANTLRFARYFSFTTSKSLRGIIITTIPRYDFGCFGDRFFVDTDTRARTRRLLGERIVRDCLHKIKQQRRSERSVPLCVARGAGRRVRHEIRCFGAPAASTFSGHRELPERCPEIKYPEKYPEPKFRRKSTRKKRLSNDYVIIRGRIFMTLHNICL